MAFIIIILLFIALAVPSIMSFMNFFEMGWNHLTEIKRNHSAGIILLEILGIPGAILGLIAGIICFRWIFWIKESYDCYSAKKADERIYKMLHKY